MLVFDKVNLKHCVSIMKQLLVLLCLGHSVGIGAAQERWVVVGDSISAGYGIPLEQGWVSLVQAKIKQKGSVVEVTNESISGDTSAGGLARLPEILDRLRPTKVILELGGNDGLRGLSPVAMKRNFSAMIELCQLRGVDVVLFGMKIPPNYGAKYTAMFEQVYMDVAKQYNVMLLPFFLEGIGGYDTLMQEDRIHPNASAQKILANNAWKVLEKAI